MVAQPPEDLKIRDEDKGHYGHVLAAIQLAGVLVLVKAVTIPDIMVRSEYGNPSSFVFLQGHVNPGSNTLVLSFPLELQVQHSSKHSFLVLSFPLKLPGLIPDDDAQTCYKASFSSIVYVVFLQR